LIDRDVSPWCSPILASSACVAMAAAAVAVRGAECEAAVEAMDNADPELDPVWGLLVGGADAGSETESFDSPPEGGGYGTAPVVAAPSAPMPRGATDRKPQEDSANEEEEDEQEPTLSEIAAPHKTPEAASNSYVVDKAQVAPSQFPLLTEVETSPTRWDVQGCDAFVIDGVLSPAECEHLVSQANGLWSFWDDTERPRVEFRNAHTIEVLHNELADRIWQRVEHLVNPSVLVKDGDDRHEVDIEGEWQPYAMNPTLLLSRYLNGGHFSPHTDGTTIVDFNRRTFYSCVLFLNDSPWGGATKIYSDDQIRRELVPDAEGRLTGDPSLVLEAVPPAPGRMLVFYHRLMHEGVPASEKYIIRTDVLYHRSPELCTEPDDKAAFDMYQEAQLLAEQGHCDASVQLFRRAFKRSAALAKVYGM